MTIDRTDTFKDENYFSHVRDYVLKQKDLGRFLCSSKNDQSLASRKTNLPTKPEVFI